ncbi:hypothetical protein [Sporolactobacillus laevolacticus]|uniref:Uncharacterized protein n=1 Tax=Sporolactobacillus laevolacticus DSM 442 TaxID=1395513 RepID=V6IUH6_9BACL|nr:hypothetical protein [Sporolactobacillus laevolacticus]EST10647.1 hypothetical protein P343_16035 [Sporolactobacillus laevolacticus DSM 442]
MLEKAKRYITSRRFLILDVPFLLAGPAAIFLLHRHGFLSSTVTFLLVVSYSIVNGILDRKACKNQKAK